MAASPMRRSDSVSFSPSTVPKSPGTLETPKSPGARRAAAGAHASTGAAMGTGAMAIIQNADMIEARLAILAEGKLDAEDALNEQAFIEECQLIIAKSAFPASAGAQAWKDVTWVGKSSQQIAAMLNRRMKGMESQIEKKVAKELRNKVSAELDALRQSALNSENAAQSAISVKNTYMEKVQKAEEELNLFRTEMADQFEQLLHAKMEAEKARNELEKQERVTSRALEGKRAADHTAGELASTVSELRKSVVGLKDELSQLRREKNSVDDKLRLSIHEKEHLHEQLDSQRVAMTNALHSTRADLEQALRDDAESWQQQVHRREEMIQDLEVQLQDQEAINLKMAAIERDCHELQEELNTSRQYIVSLMEASAKIGHFSMRTGGGYSNVGKAWEGLHRYIASTPWGKEMGLDRLVEHEGFTSATIQGGEDTLASAFGLVTGVSNEKSATGNKVPRFKVAVGPVFADSYGQRPKSARKDGVTPRSTTPRTPRALSPKTPRPLSARDKVTGNAATPRSVSITEPITPRAKTPRREESISFRNASPPRERPLSSRQSERGTPRESRMRPAESAPVPVSQRLQECASRLRFDSRKPAPKENRDAVRGRQEFSTGRFTSDNDSRAGSSYFSSGLGGYSRQGMLDNPSGRDRELERPDLNKTWMGLLKSSRDNGRAESLGSGQLAIRGGVAGANMRSTVAWSEDSPERGFATPILSSPLRRAHGRWLSEDPHSAHQDEAQERAEEESIVTLDKDALARQVNQMWEEYNAEGTEHASAISRVALPLLIKRLSPGITDGGAMLCSESILSTYCHADPYKVYRNEVLFALGKPDILDLLRPCNTERSRSNQSA